MSARKVVKLVTIPKQQSETLEDFTTRAESELGTIYSTFLGNDADMVPPTVNFLPSKDFEIVLCASFAMTWTSE